MDFHEHKFSEARIYTLGSNSWKYLEFIQIFFPVKLCGLLVDGDLDWLARSLCHTANGVEIKTQVVSFDRDEAFSITLLLDSCFLNWITSCLGMWEGNFVYSLGMKIMLSWCGR